MKFLLLVSLSLASLSAFSSQHESKQEMKKKWDAMSFEDAKKMKTEMLTEKKGMIEEAQGCVDKTTDKKGIEACMKKMHAGHDMHKDMNKDMKKKKM